MRVSVSRVITEDLGGQLLGMRSQALRETCGKRFTCGVVAYDGELAVGFGDGMFAVPLAALWA